MPTALEPLRARERVRAVVRERFGTAAQIRGVAVEQLERRVMRYTVALSLPSGRGLLWTLIGKVYESPDFGRRGFEALRQLWASGFAHGAADGIQIPEPYAYQPEHALLLMEDVPGRSLKQLLKRRRAGAEEVRLFAAAAAKLHRSPVVLTEPSTIDDYLARANVNAPPEAVAAAHPDLADPIAWVLSSARDAQARFDQDTLALCHGDLHLGQFLSDGGRLWVLDLDRAGYGDPMHDLAMVFVSLRALESRASRATYVRTVLEQFLPAYFSANRWRDAARVPVYAALIHLKRACKLFRWQDEPDWEKRIHQQVRHALLCIELLQRTGEPGTLADVVELYRRCPAKM